MLLFHGALNLCRVTLEIKHLCSQSSLPHLIYITKDRKRRKISPKVLRVKRPKGWGILREGEVPAAAQQEAAEMLQAWCLSKAVPVIENSQSTPTVSPSLQRTPNTVTNVLNTAQPGKVLKSERRLQYWGSNWWSGLLSSAFCTATPGTQLP